MNLPCWMTSGLVAPRRFFKIATAVLTGTLALQAASLQAQPTTNDPDPDEDEDEAIVLSPFVVDSTQDRGYQATSTLAGTRIRTDLRDVGSSISVITSEMLTDLGATNNETVLAYAVSTEVGGSRGNFSGNLGISGERYQEQGLFANPNGNTRVRGLTSADNTRNFFLTDIPWDSYNTSRIDLQRGPNAILFGLGSPAGVVNATTNSAEFRNRGKVEFAVDKFGSQRYVLDVNQQLIPRVLAMRISLLRDDKKFRQEPAFQLDQRAYAAINFRPEMFNRSGNTFELSGNYEYGDISSNRPRVVAPVDRITGFWDPLEKGGVNKQVFDPYNNDINTNEDPNLGGAGLGDIVAFGNSKRPISFYKEGSDSYLARRPDGTVETQIRSNNDAVPFTGSGQVGIELFPTFANNEGLPFADFGQYAQKTLTDPSVYDFYNRLLDGDNKREWNDWQAFQLNLAQTFLQNSVGYELGYFNQSLDRGTWSILGWDHYIAMDINATTTENTPNPDVGRAYIQAENRDIGNGSMHSDRQASRANVFAELDFAEKRDSLWARILGMHRVNGLVSREEVQSDSRGYRIGDFDPVSKRLFAPRGVIEGSEGVTSGFRYYLSDDLRGRSAAAGSDIANISDQVFNPQGGQVNVRYFDNTWTAPAGVNPGDPWTNPFGDETFQSENPANYKGWSERQGNFVTIFDDDIVNGMTSKDYLTSTGSLNDFEVNSLVGVWQAYLWDKSIIGTYGYREDRFRRYSYTSSERQGTGRADTGGADLGAGTYNFNNPDGTIESMRTITRNWSVAVHLNRLLGKRDFLPVNVSVYYNRGENFQPSEGSRIDAFGKPLPPPHGETEERSVLIATKDNKFSLRATKYETSVVDASSTGSVGNMWALEQVVGHPAGYARSWRLHQAGEKSLNPDDVDAVVERYGSVQNYMNGPIKAWFDFEKELVSKYPDFVQAWVTRNPNFADYATERNGVPEGSGAAQPTGMTFTEDSISKGYEFEFVANPTNNWRIAINASKTEAIRDNVPGQAFKEVAAFVYDKLENTDVGLAPQWWPGDVNGIRAQVPWTLFKPGYLANAALNGQSAIEVRKWRWNALTNYRFDQGRLRGFGVGAGYRFEDKAIVSYSPMRTEEGDNDINLDAPFYTPSHETVDFWVSYERRLSSKINWRIQLNVYNAFGENELNPISASVDYEALGSAPITPTTVIPMKATGFTIREGLSWQITNTFEF